MSWTEEEGRLARLYWEDLQKGRWNGRLHPRSSHSQTGDYKECGRCEEAYRSACRVSDSIVKVTGTIGVSSNRVIELMLAILSEVER